MGSGGIEGSCERCKFLAEENARLFQRLQTLQGVVNDYHGGCLQYRTALKWAPTPLWPGVDAVTAMEFPDAYRKWWMRYVQPGLRGDW